MSWEEMSEVFNKMSQQEQEKINTMIFDHGINDFDSLLKMWSNVHSLIWNELMK